MTFKTIINAAFAALLAITAQASQQSQPSVELNDQQDSALQELDKSIAQQVEELTQQPIRHKLEPCIAQATIPILKAEKNDPVLHASDEKRKKNRQQFYNNLKAKVRHVLTLRYKKRENIEPTVSIKAQAQQAPAVMLDYNKQPAAEFNLAQEALNAAQANVGSNDTTRIQPQQATALLDNVTQDALKDNRHKEDGFMSSSSNSSNSAPIRSATLDRALDIAASAQPSEYQEHGQQELTNFAAAPQAQNSSSSSIATVSTSPIVQTPSVRSEAVQRATGDFATPETSLTSQAPIDTGTLDKSSSALLDAYAGKTTETLSPESLSAFRHDALVPQSDHSIPSCSSNTTSSSPTGSMTSLRGHNVSEQSNESYYLGIQGAFPTSTADELTRSLIPQNNSLQIEQPKSGRLMGAYTNLMEHVRKHKVPCIIAALLCAGGLSYLVIAKTKLLSKLMQSNLFGRNQLVAPAGILAGNVQVAQRPFLWFGR